MRNENVKPLDIFWNTVGTCTYAIISLVLSIVVINIAGKTEGGIFTFGFSTLARLAFTLTFFGIRPMHIVDIQYKYSFSEYIRFGIKMAALSVLIGIFFLAYRLLDGNYSFAKTIILLILIVHGTIDGFADYYECEFQRSNKLYMCGQSLFFRISLFTASLIIALLITSNLIYAEIFAIIVEIIVFYFFNIVRSKGVFKTAKLHDKLTDSRKLLFDALPLFLITFLDMSIFSFSKIFVDSNLGDVYSGFYGLTFMPTNAIYLLMTLFMKPILTPLSNAYYNNKKEYNSILLTSFIFAAIISTIAVVVTIVLGKTYFSVLYYLTNTDYAEFSSIANNILLTVIVGGCFYTLCTPFYFSLIIENKQIYLLVAYILVFISAPFIVRYYVISLGLIGAAYGFAVSMFLIFIGVLIAKILSIIIK